MDCGTSSRSIDEVADSSDQVNMPLDRASRIGLPLDIDGLSLKIAFPFGCRSSFSVGSG